MALTIEHPVRNVARERWLDMRSTCRYLLIGMLLLAALPCAFGAAKTQASLVIPAETVRPGETIIAGVQLRMPPGWHTYWRNPGAAGGATKIQWTLPQGVTA